MKALVLSLLPLAAIAQTAPKPATPAAPAPAAAREGVSVLAEFKVFDKKPVPFTDANMDIPRGVNDVQAYYIISAEEIEGSGKVDLEELLKDNLTQNTVSESNAQIDPNGLTNQLGATSSINLRGLGASQTLILINGQRAANFANRGATYQPDTNGIPLAAIERVEVLPSSASALYGGTAVGGVVNVILKRNYRGGQVSVSYQNPFDTDAPVRTVNAIYGFPIGARTHVTISGGYSDGKPLRLKDRPFIEQYFRRAVANDPARFYSATQTFVSGATPNIALNTGAVNGFANAQTQTLTLKNGTPLNSRFTYIPYGTSASTPAATLGAQLLANAGRYNLDFSPSVFRGYESTLAHVTRKQSGMARVDHRLNDRISLFADFAFQRSSLIDSFWVPLGNGNYQFAVPGNAPTNPFRENVIVSIPIPASQASRNDITNQSANAVIGAVVKLPRDWRAAVDCNYSVSSQKVFYDLMNLANATTFGGNATLLYNGTLNPFVDTIAHPIDFPRWYGDWTGYNQDTMLDYNLRASGPLFSLPGGPPTLTVGTEIYTERLPQAYVGGTFPPLSGTGANPTNQHSYFIGQRISTYSGHAELSVPVISGRNELRFVRALELQAAVRSEEFHVYTNPNGRINVFPDAIPPRITQSATESRQDIAKLRATRPTLGLKWEPLPALTVRASYAEAFLPPTFAQLTQRINTGGLQPPSVTPVFYDPVLRQSYASLSIAGNNPGLGPETSENWNAGVIWAPTSGAFKDLRLNVEYWFIRKLGLIRNVNNVQLLANLGADAPAGSVTRDPATNRVELFTFANYNVGDGWTDGWDFSADYRRATPIGVFSFRARVTLTDNLRLPPTISYPALQYVGHVNAGGVNRLKSNLSVNWANGRRWRAGWTVVNYSGYRQAGAPDDPVYLGAANPTLVTTSTGPQGGYDIDGQTYHNATIGYSFGRGAATQALLRGVGVQVSVNNVFNTLPPFDARSGNTPFYYSRFGNVRLRDLVVRVKRDF